MKQTLTYRGTSHKPDTPTLDMQEVSLAYASVNRKLAKRETAVNALEKITFQAEPGEQIAIIGPNGAGKSTLLKVAAGLFKPNSGSVKMFGYTPDRHICIAYVPQRSEIDWQFPVTVADVVMMGRTRQIGLLRRPGKRDREIVQASLERVQMGHLARKQIGELSGGQQQRVFIARALALEANLLLMDEPLAGLDGPSQEATLDILQSLRPDKVTVLLATHDLGVAAERFDRVMLLYKQIVALGPAAAVLTTANLAAAYGGYIPASKNGTAPYMATSG
ncbi:MAG: metal ABC transporter ATP-binding protein [Ardenticatenaceae bacterium]|nr:metal ABC transporter ATP-binding protein [Ardenticatenaceae bacterium]